MALAVLRWSMPLKQASVGQRVRQDSDCRLQARLALPEQALVLQPLPRRWMFCTLTKSFAPCWQKLETLMLVLEAHLSIDPEARSMGRWRA